MRTQSEQVHPNDEDEFKKIKTMTNEAFTAYESQNRAIVKRYKEHLIKEREVLRRKNDELTKMEERLDIEVKRALPSKWLQSLLGIHVRDPKVGESSAKSQSEQAEANQSTTVGRTEDGTAGALV